MATVLLPRSLLALFPGVERRHELAGETVDAVLTALDAHAPGMRDRLVESGPRLRPHINVFVGNEAIRFADGLNTPVADGVEILIVPAVSGG